MGAMASQITSLTIVCSNVYSGADQRKHRSSASLAFVRGIHWGLLISPHKGPVTRKTFPYNDVIMSEHLLGPFGLPAGRYQGAVSSCRVDVEQLENVKLSRLFLMTILFTSFRDNDYLHGLTRNISIHVRVLLKSPTYVLAPQCWHRNSHICYTSLQRIAE